MTRRLVPMSGNDVRRFIAETHRHNDAPVPMHIMYAVGLHEDGELVGVATAGRPTSRMLSDGVTLEITRVAVKDGTRNGNSMLYGALLRAAKALGWKRVITYTLASESGESLRGAGFAPDAELKASSGWSVPSRPRQEQTLWGPRKIPTDQDKVRWVKSL